MRLLYILFVLFFSHVLLFAHERPILVDIPTFNNRSWCEKNLESVYAQRYTNYRVIITDDCSTDGTAELIEAYIKEHHQEHRTILIKNRFRRGALANHYNVIQLAHDNELIVHVDGDDWIKGTDVFHEVNKMYKNPSVWFTYGKFVNWPSNERGCPSRLPTVKDSIKLKRISRPFIFYPLRTYQARLAKYIKLEDLICSNTTVPFIGKFYPFACDIALMYTLFELSGGVHYFFNTKVMYIRNVATPLNDFKVNLDLQTACGRIIRTEDPPYKPLKTLVGKKMPVQQAHLFVFSENPAQLELFLKTLGYLKDVGAVTVVYSAGNNRDVSAYRDLSLRNRRYHFVNTAYGNATQLLTKNLMMSHYSYMLFSTPAYLLTGIVSLKRYLSALERTFAYTVSLYYRAGYEPPHDWLSDTIYVWKFGLATPHWQKPHNLAMSLYRKSDVISSMHTINKGKLKAFLKAWTEKKVNPRKVGLFVKDVAVNFKN